MKVLLVIAALLPIAAHAQTDPSWDKINANEYVLRHALHDGYIIRCGVENDVCTLYNGRNPILQPSKDLAALQAVGIAMANVK